MFRVTFIGVIAAVVFALLGMLPVVGEIFTILAMVSIALAGIALIIGLIKLLFFTFL